MLTLYRIHLVVSCSQNRISKNKEFDYTGVCYLQQTDLTNLNKKH